MNGRPSLLLRLWNFPTKSWEEKFSTFRARWTWLTPNLPYLCKLPDGFWWLRDDDFIGRSLLDGGYENRERAFMKKVVSPGMTVLDIGAHRGFHTLLFSRNVGPRGRVLAFEPSPSDAKRLRIHLLLNRSRNVVVNRCALGETDGQRTTLYVADGNTVLNSLRPRSEVAAQTSKSVVLRTVDEVLREHDVRNVDFLKLDVEGGELAVLKGAQKLLDSAFRPIIFCEVLEETTRHWNYPAREIIGYLLERRYRWFAITDEGLLTPIDGSQTEFRDNFVAVPEESLPKVRSLVVGSTCA